MGSKARAASKKSSRNQGLRPAFAISPAMLGPNNPPQPTAIGHLTQHQPAFRQCELLPFAGFPPIHRPAKPLDRPIQAVTARRVVSSAGRLDDPAQQPLPNILLKPLEGRPVEGCG